MEHSDALYKNIDHLNRKLRVISEQYASFITDIATSLSDSDSDTYAEVRERLAQSLLLEAENAAECNAEFMQDVFGIIDVIMTSMLTSCLTDASKEIGKARLLFPEYSRTNSRIAYYRTHGADEAYRTFAKALPYPTVVYAESFSSVCDDVYTGYCDFGILPIASERDGRLHTLDRLIRHNSLFITAICKADDGDNTITFALLSKEPVMLKNADHLDMDYGSSDGYLLTSLLCSLSLYEIYPKSCEMVPGDEPVWRVILPVDKNDVNRIFDCLDREYPDFKINGFYPELS